MTNFIITWSGLIFPLFGFLGVVAWRFPQTYNRLVVPAFLFILWSIFLITLSWNIGLGHARDLIQGVQRLVAEEVSSYNAPLATHDKEALDDKLKEYEVAWADWGKKYSRWAGADEAITRAQKVIDQNQLGLFDYYWFLGLFYYVLLLSSIRGWFEKMEERLANKQSQKKISD